jgi:hypothetical protein
LQPPDNLVVVSDRMESLVFDLEGWPQLAVMTFDLAGSQMADYSVFPVANRSAAFISHFRSHIDLRVNIERLCS